MTGALVFDQASRGTVCEVWVTWLAAPLLGRMDSTEGGYVRRALPSPLAALFAAGPAPPAPPGPGCAVVDELLQGGSVGQGGEPPRAWWPNGCDLHAYICRSGRQRWDAGLSRPKGLGLRAWGRLRGLGKRSYHVVCRVRYG